MLPLTGTSQFEEGSLSRDFNPALARSSSTAVITTVATQPDYYALLGVPHDASQHEIKLAYHRALLRFHPDKRNHGWCPTAFVDIALLKEAYTTLSSPGLRAQFDCRLNSRDQTRGPRPAQVISLEDFEEYDPGEDQSWRHDCRCGGMYKISPQEMDTGQHLVACNSCSEVIWVGYRVIEEGSDH